jgi:sec-independent protein translocase protein TatB
MNIFGIGNLEIIVVLVVALILLGPARMVDVARSMGKYWREAQHTLRSIADAATVKLDEPLSINVPPREPVAPPPDAVARGGPDDEESSEPPREEPTRSS